MKFITFSEISVGVFLNEHQGPAKPNLVLFRHSLSKTLSNKKRFDPAVKATFTIHPQKHYVLPKDNWHINAKRSGILGFPLQ